MYNIMHIMCHTLCETETRLCGWMLMILAVLCFGIIADVWMGEIRAVQNKGTAGGNVVHIRMCRDKRATALLA